MDALDRESVLGGVDMLRGRFGRIDRTPAGTIMISATAHQDPPARIGAGGEDRLR